MTMANVGMEGHAKGYVKLHQNQNTLSSLHRSYKYTVVLQKFP